VSFVFWFNQNHESKNMRMSIAADKKRSAKSHEAESKTDALLKARLFLNAEATRQQAMSMWLSVKPEMRIEAAIELLRADEVSLERAAEIAGLNRWAFHDILAKRRIKIVVDTAPVADLDSAVDVIRKHL
jgi:predicted HTH domain antitoxin